MRVLSHTPIQFFRQLARSTDAALHHDNHPRAHQLGLDSGQVTAGSMTYTHIRARTVTFSCYAIPSLVLKATVVEWTSWRFVRMPSLYRCSSRLCIGLAQISSCNPDALTWSSTQPPLLPTLYFIAMHRLVLQLTHPCRL